MSNKKMDRHKALGLEMQAYFREPIEVLHLALEHVHRHGPAKIQIGFTPPLDMTMARGRPQDIMLLIGELAGMGHDGLIQCSIEFA